jgi:hypothetical protein
MMKPLPLKHWLAIEKDVARHKAEIAQAFAEARTRLLPVEQEPTTGPQTVKWWWQNYLYEMRVNEDGSQRINVSQPAGLWSDLTGMNPLW